jgi:anti-sigma factor ChrR (cupin superfamily)
MAAPAAVAIRQSPRRAAHFVPQAGVSQEEDRMTATTPFMPGADTLGPLASRYVDVASLPWKPTPCPGIDMKILMEEPETGLMTALFRWQPGSELTLHEHVEIEQTFVLEGSLVDAEGEVAAGNYVWRPKGNRHTARSPNGALVLSIFLKPNIFLAGDAEGRQLK